MKNLLRLIMIIFFLNSCNSAEEKSDKKNLADWDTITYFIDQSKKVHDLQAGKALTDEYTALFIERFETYTKNSVGKPRTVNTFDEQYYAGVRLFEIERESWPEKIYNFMDLTIEDKGKLKQYYYQKVAVCTFEN